MSVERREGRPALRATARLALVATVALGLLSTAWLGTLAVARPAHAAAMAQARPTGTLTIVGARGARLYATPGGEQTGELPAGTVLTAVGRSDDSLWVVVYNDAGVSGWVEVNEVVLFGIEDLPVMVEGSVPAPSAAAGETPSALLPTPTATPPATPTPTASPTPTPLPTDTPTPIPTDTPVGRPTTAPIGGAGSVVAVVRGSGAQLFDRPDGTQMGDLPTGAALTVWGRSADSRWLVVTSVSGDAGWVLAANVVVFNVEALPVLDGVAEAAMPAASTPEPMLMPETAPSTAPSAGESATSVPAPAAQPTVAAPAPNMETDITATVLVTDARLNIRSGPGTGYRVISKAEPGAVLGVSGRDRTAMWIEVLTPDVGDGYGWVAAEYVALSHPILGIPLSPRTPDPQAQSGGCAPAPQVQTGGCAPAPVVATGLTGKLVFQTNSGGTIYVYDLVAGTLTELTGGFDPAISPDGKTVAFTRMSDDDGLYLIDIDGRNERRIYRAGEPMLSPSWSPDGRYLTFVRIAGDYTCRDVGYGICLPNNPFLGNFPLDKRPEWGLSRVDTDGLQFRDLAALTSAQAPDWSADGIVYQANNGIEITADQPDATTRSVVAAPYYQDPNWQPGGNRIVFQSREGSHWEIFIVNTDGTGLSALTRPVTTLVDELPSNVAPVWSPDGRWIVYLSNRNADNSAGDWRLWVMDADGGNQHPLPVNVPIEYSFVNEQVVSWGISG